MSQAITISNLSFSYPDGRTALRSVNLSVCEGETLGIVGPNGAGKSTLLLHCNGILRAARGTVTVLGREITNESLKWVRSRVGLVFQDPDDQLFSLTVFDDVAFGPLNAGLQEAAVREAVAEALRAVAMESFGTRSSHHLSFGERKRIAIATVLATRPEILVLDEPTGGLDPLGRWSFVKLLKGLEMTCIVASHDMDLVRSLCDRVVVIRDGRVLAEGSTADVMCDTDLLVSAGLLPPPDEDSSDRNQDTGRGCGQSSHS